MNSINPSTQYPKVERGLHRIAWRAANRYSEYLTYEEALSQVHFGFMQACERFDPWKGTRFITYCYYLARMRVLDLVKKRFNNPVIDPEEAQLRIDATQTHYPANLCMEVIEELTYDAQEILGLILDTPEDLLQGVRSPKVLFERVLEHLTWTKGKSQEELRLATEEIEFYFRRIWRSS